jgi:hypothetical protein
MRRLSAIWSNASSSCRDLGLADHHFFCGISQLAVGADTLFTRACAKAGWLQRIFLPQPREDFLAAVNDRNEPDFTPSQREQANTFFSSDHIIQERVVSDSSDRKMRFEDVNLELVRVSDVVVCLMDASAGSGRGGTGQVRDEALRRTKPLLEIRVSVESGRPRFDVHRHHFIAFDAPSLPTELSRLPSKLTGVPSVVAYCAQLKDFASRTSRLKQRLFKTTALVIIGAHVLATLCAVIAGTVHDLPAWPLLLTGELGLLLIGLCTHEHLHYREPARVWAMARVVAEVARSVGALKSVRGYLTHFTSLPLPDSLQPLLRTLSVLHLRETHRLQDPWENRRQRYVEERLTSSQIPYYDEKHQAAARWHTWARIVFLGASGFAILATSFELIGTTGHLPEWLHALESARPAWPNGLAIILPVFAVAALSLAIAFDVEARKHTYDEALKFLGTQRKQLEHAMSERSFCMLAMETEGRLLGETVSWYARHTAISVA